MNQPQLNLRRNVWVGAAGVLGAIIVVVVAGWQSANDAANRYQSQSASAISAIKPVATQAATVKYSDLPVVDGNETPAQYAAEQTRCLGITAVTAAADKLTTPQISTNWWVKLWAFTSKKYRTSRQDALHNATATQLTALKDHLSRLTHACQVDVKAVAIYEQDYANSQARAALVDFDYSDCGANGCLDESKNAAYKALMPTELAAYRQYGEFLGKECDYPELTDYCRTYSKYELPYDTAYMNYYNGLVNGADMTTLANLTVAAGDEAVKASSAALMKVAPALTKACEASAPGEDCGLRVAVGLQQQDEQAIAAAAAALLKR